MTKREDRVGDRKLHAWPPSTRAPTVGVLAAIVALAACGGEDGTGPGDPTITEIVVTAGSSSLAALGATLQASAEARDADGDPVPGVSFTWSSSDDGVATVSASGLVTAVGNGAATITASASGVEGSLAVTVEQVPASLVFVSQPGNGSARAELAPEVQVELRDANGHLAENATDAVSIQVATNPTGGALTGTLFRNANAGVAAFPGLAIDRPGVGYTLAASSDGLSAESDPFRLTLPSVYVANGDGLVVIDLSDHSIVASPTVPGAEWVAITPDGLFAYVVSRSTNSASAVATTTNTVVAEIPLPDIPQRPAITPDGSEVWIGSRSDTISIIDTERNTIAETMGDFVQIPDIAFAPDGATAYATESAGLYLAVIDVATRSLTTTVPTVNASVPVDVTPNGERVYVGRVIGSEVRVIDTATNTTVDSIQVAGNPRDMAFTPGGTSLYVVNDDGSNSGQDNVLVIDTSTNVGFPIFVDDEPSGIAITPDGSLAYVTDNNDGTVFVIDNSTNTVVETITVGGAPEGVAIMPPPVP